MAEHDRRQPTFDDEFEIEGSFPQPTSAAWREAARRSLDGRDPESLTATTHEGIAVHGWSRAGPERTGSAGRSSAV